MAPRRCRFTPDGRWLVSVGYRGVRIHDGVTGALRHRDLEDAVINDCTAAGGGRFTLGDSRGNVLVFDVERGELVEDLFLDVSRVQGSCVSPGGDVLLAAGGRFTSTWDEAAHGASDLWRVGTWENVDGHERRHDKPALNCAFVAGGRAYVVGLQDGTLEVFDTASGELVGRHKQHDTGLRGLATTPDGRYLISAGFDGRLRVWDVDELLRPATPTAGGRSALCAVRAGGLTGDLVTVAVDAYSSTFAAQRLTDDGARASSPAVPFRSRELADLGLRRDDPGLPLRVWSFASDPTGTRPAHRMRPASADGGYWLVHAPARMSPPAFAVFPALDQRLWSERNELWCVSPDGGLCALVRGGIEVTLHASTHDVLLGTLRTNQRPSQVAFLADGETVALALGDAVHLLQLGASARALAHPGVVAFCQSPAADRLVTGGADGRLRLWDLRDGALLGTYPAHPPGGIVDVAFAGDEEFVSAGSDGTILLWGGDGTRLAVLAAFVAEDAITALDADPEHGVVLVGDAGGRADLLRLRPPAGGGLAGVVVQNAAEVVDPRDRTADARVGQRQQRAELGRGAPAEGVGRPGDVRAAELPLAAEAPDPRVVKSG